MLSTSTIHTFFFDNSIKLVLANNIDLLTSHKEVYENEIFLHEKIHLPLKIQDLFKKDYMESKNSIFIDFTSEAEGEPMKFLLAIKEYILFMEKSYSFLISYPRRDSSSSSTSTYKKDLSTKFLSMPFRKIGGDLREPLPIPVDAVEYADEFKNSDFELNELPRKYNYIYYDQNSCLSRFTSQKLNEEWFPELTFVQEINLDKVTEKKFLIEKHFKNIFYEKIDDLQNVVNAFSLIYKFEKQQPVNKTLSIDDLKTKITTLFTINNENEKIKSSTLQELISTKLSWHYSSEELKKLKIMLPVVLKELNVEKKRLKDGNYYIGIVEKKISNLDVNEGNASLKERIKYEIESRKVMDESIKEEFHKSEEDIQISEDKNGASQSEECSIKNNLIPLYLSGKNDFNEIKKKRENFIIPSIEGIVSNVKLGTLDDDYGFSF